MKLDRRIVCALCLMLVACQFDPGAMPPTPAASSTQTSELPTTPNQTSVPPPAAPPGGTASFRDQLAVADQLVVSLTNVAAPPTGQAYQGWLLGDAGSLLNLGVLPVEADGTLAFTWNAPNTENLLSRYTRLEITLEPAAGSANPTGPVVLAGGLEGEALATARRLFVKNDSEPATPLDTAFARGLLAQTEVAVQHITNAFNAAAIGALPEMRAHLEHVVNAIEGASGSHFGDHDGNHTAENPGDGFGVIRYSAQIAALLSAPASAREADANIQAQSAAIQSRCLEILALDDAGAAATQLAQLQETANQFKTSPVAELYRAAQEAASFAITPSP